MGITRDGDAYYTETGEIREGALIWVPERIPSGFGRSFFLMTVDALSVLADHRKVIGEEGFAVFGKLMKRLDFENYMQVSQADIARELGMQRSNVSRAITRLCQIGIVAKGPKVGTSYTYRLHPEAGWKGKPQAHHKAREAARAMGWRILPGGEELPTQKALPLENEA